MDTEVTVDKCFLPGWIQLLRERSVALLWIPDSIYSALIEHLVCARHIVVGVGGSRSMNVNEVQILHKFLYRKTCIVGTERAQQCTVVVTFAMGLKDYLGVC